MEEEAAAAKSMKRSVHKWFGMFVGLVMVTGVAVFVTGAALYGMAGIGSDYHQGDLIIIVIIICGGLIFIPFVPYAIWLKTHNRTCGLIVENMVPLINECLELVLVPAVFLGMYHFWHWGFPKGIDHNVFFATTAQLIPLMVIAWILEHDISQPMNTYSRFATTVLQLTLLIRYTILTIGEATAICALVGIPEPQMQLKLCIACLASAVTGIGILLVHRNVRPDYTAVDKFARGARRLISSKASTAAVSDEQLTADTPSLH
jgi:hypothetical protein